MTNEFVLYIFIHSREYFMHCVNCNAVLCVGIYCLISKHHKNKFCNYKTREQLLTILTFVQEKSLYNLNGFDFEQPQKLSYCFIYKLLMPDNISVTICFVFSQAHSGLRGQYVLLYCVIIWGKCVQNRPDDSIFTRPCNRI